MIPLLKRGGVKLEKIVFIAGPHGVGKTYTTDKLKEDLDILHLDLGPIIRSLHKEQAPDRKMGDWLREGEELYGKNYSDMLLCGKMSDIMKSSVSKIALITGSRSLAGMIYIVNHFGLEHPTLVYLDAPVSLLKSNYENRENLNLSNNDFDNILRAEIEMGLLELKKYAQDNSENAFYIVNENNSTDTIDKIKDIIQKPTVIRRSTHYIKSKRNEGNGRNE